MILLLSLSYELNCKLFYPLSFPLLRIKKLSVSKAFDLTLYMKRETQIMPILQGMNELVPIYKLMERRDTNGTEKQLKVIC